MNKIGISVSLISVIFHFVGAGYFWGVREKGSVVGWVSAGELRRSLYTGLNAAVIFFSAAAAFDNWAVWVLSTIGVALATAANVLKRLRDGEGAPALVFPGGEARPLSGEPTSNISDIKIEK